MPAEKTEKLIKVKLLRAHWIGEERINPPAELEVSLEEALRLIEAGVASRTDVLKAD
jgi:hypothetical protein